MKLFHSSSHNNGAKSELKNIFQRMHSFTEKLKNNNIFNNYFTKFLNYVVDKV